MIYVIYGFIGAFGLVALMAVGCVAGWQAHKVFVRHTTPKAEPPGVKERQEMIEQQQAFHTIQNYSTERAYGMMDPVNVGGDSG